MSAEIRTEAATDREGIWALHTASFPTNAEAVLVNRLRDQGDVAISLVAVDNCTVVGHALLSKMQSPERCLGLAPVSVASSQRRQGVASRLIRDGLVHAKRDGWAGVFVLGGHYYRRFGFDPALAAGFSSPYSGPHLMALSLRAEDSLTPGGRAEYARAFAELA